METVDLKSCERALVYGTDKKPLSSARVLDTGFTVYLFLANRSLRKAKIKVYVDFYSTTQGVIRCICGLNIHRNQQIGNPQEVWAADCKVLKRVSVIQRHKDFRVPVTMPVLFLTGAGVLSKGIIKNISAGGIFIVTNQILKNGDKFSYDMVLNDSQCMVKAQVVYGRQISGSYGYGCSFCDLPEHVIRTIRYWCHTHQERKEAI